MPRRARAAWQMFLRGADPEAGLDDVDHDRLYRFGVAMFLGHTPVDLDALEADLERHGFGPEKRREVLSVVGQVPKILATFPVMRGF